MNLEFCSSQYTPIIAPKVSYVIPTYNRCPSTNVQENPLAWCIESLMHQADGPVHEVLVVDDASTDNTELTVKSLQERYNVRARRLGYVRQQDRKGDKHALNKGIELTSAPLICFADDDIVYASHYTFAAAAIFNSFPHKRVGAVSLPVYIRSDRPKSVLPMDRIGRIDFDAGTWSGEFASYPEEYGDTPPTIPGFNILEPFNVDYCLSAAVYAREALEAVNGWDASSPFYLMDAIEIGASITAAGYEILHSPDPRYGIMHLKFGSARTKAIEAGSYQNFAICGTDFETMIRLSSAPRINTGHRMETDDFNYYENFSIAYLLFPRSDRGSVIFLKRTFQAYVVDNRPFTKTYGPSPLNMAERFDLWKRAVNYAIELRGHLPVDRRNLIQSTIDELAIGLTE
jgi:glycosyltransferase involved in cell wall biosynthesis